MKHQHKNRTYSNRVFHPKFESLHVPSGGELAQIKFGRWIFFTDNRNWAWDEILMDKDEAIELCIAIAAKYGISTADELELRNG